LANPFPEFKVRVKQEPAVDTLTVAEKSSAACSEEGESVEDALSLPSVEDVEVPPVEEKADDVKLEAKVDSKVESSIFAMPLEPKAAQPMTPVPTSAAVVSVASSPARAASSAEVTPAAKELPTVPQIFFPPAIEGVPPPMFGMPGVALEAEPAEPPEVPSGEVSPMSAPGETQELDSWAADQANLFLQSMFTQEGQEGDISPSAPRSRAEDPAVVPVSDEDEAEEEPEGEHEDEPDGEADEVAEPEAEDDAVPWPEGPPPGDWEEPEDEEDQAAFDEGECEEEEDLEDDDLEEVVENDTAPSAPRRAMLSAVKEPLERPPGNFGWNVWTNPMLAGGSHEDEAAPEVSRGSKGSKGKKGNKGTKGGKGTKGSQGKGSSKGQSEGKGWTGGWNTWKAPKATESTKTTAWENDSWSQEENQRKESSWKSEKEWKGNDDWKPEKEWKTPKEWNTGEEWKAPKEWKASNDWSGGTGDWKDEKEWKASKWEQWKPKASSSKSENDPWSSDDPWSSWKKSKWPEEQQNQTWSSNQSWSRSRGNTEAW